MYIEKDSDSEKFHEHSTHSVLDILVNSSLLNGK